MRTYRQYCAVAKALDLIGDRWTLLIVRELLVRGACRYTDLRNGLPGIATNLLADRLRELEQAGIVSREQVPPPVATTLFELTTRGAELAALVRELVRWGSPLMEQGPASGDVFRGQWLTLPLEMSLADREPDAAPVTIQVFADGEPAFLTTSAGAVRVTPGLAEHADAVVRGPAHPVLGLLTGRIELDRAAAIGVECEGERAAIERVLPEPAVV
ncbi:MAG TPA: helix-turn-helix domain-containing protein [Solirubrobacteraceae bacterium]|nr:helix-turn-helix domain-containing protein [Solirubrobacteraceae bacterium]